MPQDKMLVLDQPHQIAFYQLCARRSALGLELKGLRHSRGVSVYAICKRVYKLKGNRQRVYDQMCKLVEDVKSGKVEFVPPLPV